MNQSMVRYLLSKLLMIEAGLLCVPLLVALIYRESWQVTGSLLLTQALLLGIGGLGSYFKPKRHHLYTKEGLLIVALCWILWSFFGALPFYFSGQIPNLIDAFFETASGLTTTGASILTDVEQLTPAITFWRSFTHLIGGMGVLVFALAIMGNSSTNHLEVMRAEVPGPVFGKVVSKLKETAKLLYLIYLIMFVITVLILFACGMPFFDSLIIGMGSAGTGGFASYNASIAHYDSHIITLVVSIATLCFGINFNLYYFLLLKKSKAIFADEELRTYVGIVVIATLLITLNLLGSYESWTLASEHAFFQVANIITTTGFGITDISIWPLFSQVILLFLMFIGGSAGSTAGGLKVMRILILTRITKNQVRSTLSPNRLQTVHLNGTVLDKDTQHSILKYLTLYLLCLIGLTFLLSLDHTDFFVVFSAVASCFNNIGPMLGTSDSFAIFSPLSKLLLSFAMIAGRLEIYPILLLFIPKTWSKV